MSRGRYEKASSQSLLWPVIFAIVLLVALPLIFILKGCSGAQPPHQGSTAATVEKKTDSIAIPGYEALELKAGSKKQSLCLPNPPQNTCYFQISLFLEDGTLIWKSELIAPGKNSKPIVLIQELEQGTYSKAVLHYSCFEMNKDLTPLNGAEIKVTLRVK